MVSLPLLLVQGIYGSENHKLWEDIFPKLVHWIENLNSVRYVQKQPPESFCKKRYS